MVQSMIRSEVSSIAELTEYLTGDKEGFPDGFEEMPSEVKWELGSLICQWAQAEAGDDKELCVNLMLLLNKLACVSFLMGRQFGKLEATVGLKKIAGHVPMCPTDFPTAQYKMADGYVGK